VGVAGWMKSESKERGHQIRHFSCGLVSGLIQAIVFNPWDRALYLSVKESRIFCTMENFRHPFSGLLQTIFQRAISAGLYFPLEQSFMEYLSEKYSNKNISLHWIALASGTCAGAINGLALNPLAAIKVSDILCLLLLSVLISTSTILGELKNVKERISF
jgi:hypothetical protein